MNLIRGFLLTVVSEIVITYAAEGINLFNFLMSSSNQHSQNISFSPDDGKKFRRSFELKYGPKGKHLIESMGHGSSTLFPSSSPAPNRNVTIKIIKKKRKPSST